MENLDKIIQEIKGMDKTKRNELLGELSKDKKTMEQVRGLLSDPEMKKKLKDLLR